MKFQSLQDAFITDICGGSRLALSNICGKGALSPDCAYLAVAAPDGKVGIYQIFGRDTDQNLSTERIQFCAHIEGGKRVFQWSPTSAYLLVDDGSEKRVQIVYPAARAIHYTDLPYTFMEISPNGMTLACVVGFQEISCHAMIERGTKIAYLRTCKTPPFSRIKSIAFQNVDTLYVLSGSQDTIFELPIDAEGCKEVLGLRSISGTERILRSSNRDVVRIDKQGAMHLARYSPKVSGRITATFVDIHSNSIVVATDHDVVACIDEQSGHVHPCGLHKAFLISDRDMPLVFVQQWNPLPS